MGDNREVAARRTQGLSRHRLNAQIAVMDMTEVEQVVDELTSKGVTLEQYEGVLESGFDYGADMKGIPPRAGGGKVAWFKGPDGNIFVVEGDR
jgi:hypothetical protein